MPETVRLEALNDLGVCLKDVAQLLRVVLQIIKLIHIVVASDPFVAAVKQHCAVVQFAALYGAQRFIPPRSSGVSVRASIWLWSHVRPARSRQVGGQIHQFSQRVAVAAGLHIGGVDDQRNAQAAFVHGGFFQQAVVPQQFAMVGAEDDNGIFHMAGCFKPVQQTARPSGPQHGCCRHNSV